MNSEHNHFVESCLLIAQSSRFLTFTLAVTSYVVVREALRASQQFNEF